MNWQAGVDEAGLGPILGPLVVAGVALGGPAGTDPWRAMRGLVCRDRAEKGKIRVADSKKVNQGKHGLAHLERAALAFWAAWRGDLPADLVSLLEALGADVGALRAYPWYGELDLPLPLRCDAKLIELDAHRLAKSMRASGIEIGKLVARPVDVAEFNALIAETDNKSRAHFSAYSRVIAELLAHLPGGAHLVADRCGGRAHYQRPLRRAFPGAEIRTIDEHAGLSSYEIGTETGPVQVSFAERAEDRAFPTALASCIAKYVRELMLHLLNEWFGERLPGLEPTHGYYVDGHRFLADVESVIAGENLRRDRLVRSR